MDKEQAPQYCAECPNRKRLSRLLAKATRSFECADGCNGPTIINHGVVQSVELPNYERDESGRVVRAPGPDFKATIHSTSYGNSDPSATSEHPALDMRTRHTGITWNQEIICGREPIKPSEGEVPYDPENEIITDENGRRQAAYVSGSEDGMRELGYNQDVTRIIDASYDSESDDPEVVAQGQDQLEKFGVKIVASTARYGLDTPE